MDVLRKVRVPNLYTKAHLNHDTNTPLGRVLTVMLFVVLLAYTSLFAAWNPQATVVYRTSVEEFPREPTDNFEITLLCTAPSGCWYTPPFQNGLSGEERLCYYLPPFRMANVMIHQSDPIDPFTAVWGFGSKSNPSNPDSQYIGMEIFAEKVSLPDGSSACAFDFDDPGACYAVPYTSTSFTDIFSSENKPDKQPLHFGLSHISLVKGTKDTLTSSTSTFKFRSTPASLVGDFSDTNICMKNGHMVQSRYAALGIAPADDDVVQLTLYPQPTYVSEHFRSPWLSWPEQFGGILSILQGFSFGVIFMTWKAQRFFNSGSNGKPPELAPAVEMVDNPANLPR